MTKTARVGSEGRKAEVAGARKYKILIVDDEECVQEILASRLRPEGYEISIDHDGGDALERIVKGGYSPDLMITDINMPRMDGLELINYLGYKEYTSPIIVNSDSSKKIPSYSGKLKKMIGKDFGSEELKRTIKELLTN